MVENGYQKMSLLQPQCRVTTTVQNGFFVTGLTTVILSQNRTATRNFGQSERIQPLYSPLNAVFVLA
jgi:hypothetical protein